MRPDRLRKIRAVHSPQLEPFLSAPVKIREFHNPARPMTHREPGHTQSDEFERLCLQLAERDNGSY